ncbi:hypothetical protein MFFC18_41530 [Mariniblastus fucicola]|uniref:Putative restriction endonuclease domain-containing protein n=1 Tax=Mariniblastus fucicola TaxID=980251 RepID=A0A5B9PHU1_9BACT|nr:Uma2 family endonuclease [Mariniblastus fucicola]QEG24236.1 hypothetical protein MFFC18_41530 [Mariniblastus fucicola]
MSSAEKYIPRYTVDDYQHWEGDWQLVEGIAISMNPSPFGPHERAVSRISLCIGNAIEEADFECESYAGLDWIVSDETVVRPDVMVVCGEQPERHLENPQSSLWKCFLHLPESWTSVRSGGFTKTKVFWFI